MMTNTHNHVRGYTGWALDPEQRKYLLTQFPPAYAKVIAHHCTQKFGVNSDHPLPVADEGEIVGMADDGVGVQALVLRIHGTTHRPDGGTWHITWSLASGRKPVESNTVIAHKGWQQVEPVTIKLRPQFFPMGS